VQPLSPDVRPGHDHDHQRRQRNQPRHVAPANAAQQAIGGHPGARRAQPPFAPCYRAPPPPVGDHLMAAPTPTYDLMLLLDPAAPDEQRTKILADTEASISSAGSVVSKHDWGARPTAYEIRHKGEAEYHLIQFQGAPDLLADLQRTLRITDGVVRFRIIKVAPGTPAPPEPPRIERPAPEAEVPAA
jgi:small subunit ribosomal protein S6